MIKIVKPAAPAVLTDKGAAKAGEHKAAFDAEPDLFRNGDKKLEIDAAIYRHRNVKKALRKAQHDKCAFCESKITHVSYGNIEHYRPKMGFQQQREDPICPPGYYWLAYDWDNLLLACECCNNSGKDYGKGNLFPLEDPGARALDHSHDITQEKPLLLHPAKDDPAEHLVFNGADISPKNGSKRGDATIKTLGLDRSELFERRYKWLKTIQTMLRLLPLGAPQDHEARVWLRENLSPDAEYSAMARAATEGVDI
jgi:uncharacterized protein (TIGR02646 family)